MIAKTLGVAAAAAFALTALSACDRSAQSADGAVSEGAVGTAANTPSGQVVPTTGTNEGKLNTPEITGEAPAPGTPGGASADANSAGAAAGGAEKH